jgi:hypothetical protein
MSTRFVLEMNPAYPAKGERRFAVFRLDPVLGRITRLAQFTSRRAGERLVCILQVEHDLARLGLISEKTRP